MSRRKEQHGERGINDGRIEVSYRKSSGRFYHFDRVGGR